MPINPAYQFMNSAADLSDKNQFMDFLRHDAQAKGFDSNYSAGIANDQQMMNTMAAQQPQPAPQPQRPVPNGSRAFTRTMPQVNTEIPEVPEQPQPEVAENVGPQGYEGLGNFDELPMASEPPQSDKHNDQQSQELKRFEQTKLAKQGMDMGMDPRQLMVALAQFSAGMGNIHGKDTHSTAADFYGMQKKVEGQEEARRIKQEEFAARMAPKAEDPLDTRLKLARIASLQNKSTDPNIALANSLRTQLLQKQLDQEVDPNKKKLLAAQLAKTEAETKALGPSKPGEVYGKDQMQRTTDFRKQYASDKVTVNTQLAKDTWLRAKTVIDSDSPAGQIATVYSFMKSLDPTSTVRESEYATAESARAAMDTVTNYANKIENGKRLTAAQIKDFRGIMEKLYKRQMLEQKAKNQEYRNLAKNFGVAEQDIGLIEDTEPTPTPAAQGPRGYQTWAP
jgi:hypothetical protein